MRERREADRKKIDVKSWRVRGEEKKYSEAKVLEQRADSIKGRFSHLADAPLSRAVFKDRAHGDWWTHRLLTCFIPMNFVSF